LCRWSSVAGGWLHSPRIEQHSSLRKLQNK
jgi:hypothetical protein